MVKVDKNKVLEKIIDKLLDLMGITADYKIDQDDDGTLLVKVEGEELGALIGYHGETLESLQLVLSLILNKQLKSEDWNRVVVDVGNWREDRKEILKGMVERAVESIQTRKLEKVALPIMSASQRREVHVLVTDNYQDFEAASEGEEPNRRIILFRK